MRSDRLAVLARGWNPDDVPDEPRALHGANDQCGRVELPAPQAMRSRLRERVMVVVPRLPERQWGEPGEVARLVAGREWPAPEAVAERVDRVRGVVQQHDAHGAAPQEARQA